MQPHGTQQLSPPAIKDRRQHAGQTLRVFNADDYHPQTKAGDFNPTLTTPLYGGSDRTGYRFDFGGSLEVIPLAITTRPAQ